MKAEELRIGNFVGSFLREFPDNYFTMVEISEHACVLVEGLDQTNRLRDRHYFECDDLEGIPITPEYLIRSGCKENGRLYLENTTPFNFVFVDGYVFYNGLKIECPYVHTIQNLYFALTGEELTLKP